MCKAGLTIPRRELLPLILLLSICICGSPLLAQAAEPRASLGTSAFFTTSDGVKLHYLDAGRGRPIIFVPGGTAAADIWEPQIREFSREFRVIALDNRAHGLSELASTGTGGYEFPRLAADIHELIEHLGLSKIVLVGWSMAVKQVLTYVERHGTDRISGVVLVDGSLWGTQESCAKYVDLKRAVESDPDSYGRAQRGWFVQPHPEDFFRRVDEAQRRIPRNVIGWLGMVAHCSPDSDKRAGLPKLHRASIPVLYILSSTAMTPHADELKARVPGARVEVLPGGHAPAADYPGRFNELLKEFLEHS